MSTMNYEVNAILSKLSLQRQVAAESAIIEALASLPASDEDSSNDPRWNDHVELGPPMHPEESFFPQPKEKTHMASNKLFTHISWTVTENEDGNFDILDHDGDVVDEAMTIEDAKEACISGAKEAYRRRLRDKIIDADLDNVNVVTLETIARWLNIKI